MPRETKAEFHDRCLRQFVEIQTAVRHEREQMLEDRRFVHVTGGMWTGDWGKLYDNRPRMEINRIAQTLQRMKSEYRSNRISVDFRPRGGEGSDDLADALDGLYRADEVDCGAQEAYDVAFDEGMSGGLGAWRLRAAYEDESDPDNDHQRIVIEPITDADSRVFWGLAARKQDKSDARYAYILTGMPIQAYRDEYDDDPATWPKDIRSDFFEWCSGDTVYVAEYYEIGSDTETWVTVESIDGTEEKLPALQWEPQAEMRTALGDRVTKTREIRRPIVRKWTLSGGKILKGPDRIPGRHIPIVPFFADRHVVDNVERARGIVRIAKDAQRLYNMQVSRLAHIAALTPHEKPILTPEQVAGHELWWADDPLMQRPYMLVNPITDANGNQTVAGPVAYTKPPDVPPVMAALIQQTAADIQQILGVRDDQVRSNVSAQAVELVQNSKDMQGFVIFDNFAKAMKRSGEIWLEMARDVYVEEGREMESVGEQGETSVITLMRPVIDPDTSETIVENDISRAKMKVLVDVGPSFATRRDSTVRSLTGMMQSIGPADPQTVQILAQAALMNMDGEGLGDLRDYFRQRLLRAGVLKPTDEEAQTLAQEAESQGPDPQAAYLAAAAQNEQAKAQKAQADTALALARADESKAKAAETIAGIDTDRQRLVLDAIDRTIGG